MRRALILIPAALALLAGCDQRPADAPKAKQKAEAEPDTVDIPQGVEKDAPGTTPMAQRVAVLGFLNKRNGITQDLRLRPGQAVRVGNVVVRLRACETTAPWEVQQLTGAFVQLDVPNPQGQYRRVFSGWLYKESPSLNVIEDPVYDVWPKSCAMTHSGGTPASEPASSSRSSAPKSGAPKATAASTPSAAPADEETSSPADSAEDNSAR